MRQEISRGSQYDIGEWGLWLWQHGIDIDTVKMIQFDERTGWATAHVYAVRNGKRYVEHGRAATRRHHFRMRTPHPDYS